MTVSGFISRVDKWDRFERRWSKILREYGLSTFHMTDYVSGQGDYSQFKGNSPLRKTFQDQLTACVAKNTNKAIRFTLILRDYREVNRRFKLRERLGPPYVICARECLMHARNWARKKKCESTMLYYFEKGDKDQGLFEKAAEEMVSPSQVIFLAKGALGAFQAADFMAWKTKANMEKVITAASRPNERHRLRESLGSLNNIPTVAEVLIERSLLAICKELRIERR